MSYSSGGSPQPLYNLDSIDHPAAPGPNSRRFQPLQKDINSGYLPGHYWLTAIRFERIYRTSTAPSAGGTHFQIDRTPSDRLIGAEILTDAQRELAFVKTRMGPLFDVLRRACVEDAPLWQLATSNRTLSMKIPDLTGRGRERVRAAFDVCDAAHAAFDDLVRGTSSPRERAFGVFTNWVPAAIVEAANDNERQIGNAFLRQASAAVFQEDMTSRLIGLRGDPVAANDNRARIEIQRQAEERRPYLAK